MSGKESPRRILLVRPSALGDVCRSVPVLVSLARAWPDATLGWVVQDGFEDAIRSHPDLDEVVTFPRKALARWATRPTVLIRSINWLRSLRRGRWDCVVDCQGLVRSGIMSWASGARCRVGDRGAREGAWLAYNHRVVTPRDEHTVNRMLKLLEPLSVEPVRDMRLYPPPEAIRAWEARRRELGLEGDYAVAATTTRWPSKAWPEDHWVTLARAMEKESLPALVLVGSESEQADVAKLADRLRQEVNIAIHDLSGKTGVGDLMALIESARITIANDTAALHMAVGLGGRCVGLFGPTDPARVGPYGLQNNVVYAAPDTPVNYKDSRLGDRLMRSVSVESVIEVVQRVLGESTCQSSSPGGDGAVA